VLGIDQAMYAETHKPVAQRTLVDVRFAPKATRLLRSSELTRSANNGHNQPAYPMIHKYRSVTAPEGTTFEVRG